MTNYTRFNKPRWPLPRCMLSSTLLIKSMATFGYNLSLSEAPAAAAEEREGLFIDDLDHFVSHVEKCWMSMSVQS